MGARDAGDRFCIFSMRFSQDGDEILCGAKDGDIYLYDRGANRRSLKVFPFIDYRSEREGLLKFFQSWVES